MARKDVNPELVRRLFGARQAFLRWREEFPEKVKVLRAQQRAEHMKYMEDAALDMLEDGASVAFIMDTYGTSDRRVITRMLNNASERRAVEGDQTTDYEELAEILRLDQQAEREGAS